MGNGFEFKYDVYQLTDEEILNATFIVHQVTKREVVGKDLSSCEYIFNKLRGLKKAGRGKLVLLFSGYDDVPDEIYSIKEIRDFVLSLFEKYPHMFYYLSQKDASFRSIFLCLCDFQSVSPAKKDDIRDVIFDNKEITLVQTQFEAPESIFNTLVSSTIKYGLSMGDSETATNQVLENLFGEYRENPIDYTNDVSDTLMDVYKQSAYCMWNGLVEKSQMSIIPEFMVLYFLKQNEHLVNHAKKAKKLMIPLLSPDRNLTNLFLVRDIAYGKICPTCGTNHIILLKNNLTPAEEDSLYSPILDNYLMGKIVPMSDEFTQQYPIPIDYKKDKWICPNCQQIHKFEYLEDFGLKY